MCQKRGLLYGATATHYSSDIPSLLFKCVWFILSSTTVNVQLKIHAEILSW